MTRTIFHVVCSVSLTISLVQGCSETSGGRLTAEARNDGGGAFDAGGEPTMRSMVESENDENSADEGGTGREPRSRADGGPRSAAGQSGDEGGASGHQAAGPLNADGGNTSDVPDDGDAGPTSSGGLCTSCGECEETQEITGNMHTNMPVAYADPPPTSGPHNPCWARWGIHDAPVQAERWVHNLEHGGVVFLYNCPDGCESELGILTNLASTRERTVVTAYAGMPKRFAVVSWGHRLMSDCLDERALTEFYAKNFNRGPESNAMHPNPSCPP